MFSVKMEDFRKIKEQFEEIYVEMLKKAQAKRIKHQKKIAKHEKKFPVYGMVLNSELPAIGKEKMVVNLKTLKERELQLNPIANQKSITKDVCKCSNPSFHLIVISNLLVLFHLESSTLLNEEVMKFLAEVE